MNAEASEFQIVAGRPFEYAQDVIDDEQRRMMEVSVSAFHMTCGCGHDIKVDAKDRPEAVSKIQGIMTKDAIAAH